ncbi:hypothetical protein CCMA1212_009799 [Trichoderma ghanense]|uniref:Uncharacterized protein n=1 Tax=Trichoderma ghanense TaxID=65468 RepID=A0ABY2GSA3_9HYPO
MARSLVCQKAARLLCQKACLAAATSTGSRIGDDAAEAGQRNANASFDNAGACAFRANSALEMLRTSLEEHAALSNRGNDDAQQPSGKEPTEGAILPTQSCSKQPSVGIESFGQASPSINSRPAIAQPTESDNRGGCIMETLRLDDIPSCCRPTTRRQRKKRQTSAGHVEEIGPPHATADARRRCVKHRIDLGERANPSLSIPTSKLWPLEDNQRDLTHGISTVSGTVYSRINTAAAATFSSEERHTQANEDSSSVRHPPSVASTIAGVAFPALGGPGEKRGDEWLLATNHTGTGHFSVCAAEKRPVLYEKNWLYPRQQNADNAAVPADGFTKNWERRPWHSPSIDHHRASLSASPYAGRAERTVGVFRPCSLARPLLETTRTSTAPARPNPA